MKKNLLLLSVVTILFSCNKASDNEYILTGSITGIANGKNVMLESQDEKTGQWKAIDTVKTEDGKFTFKGSAKEPEMYLIQVETIQGKVAFVLENGDIEAKINKDTINNSTVTGTYNNDEFTNFKEKQIAIQKRIMKFEKDNVPKMQAAQQTSDTTTITNLQKEYSKFEKELIKQSEDYAASHPKAYISALIIQDMFNQRKPDFTKIEKYYNNLDASLKTGKPGKKIKEHLDKIKATAVGNAAPGFSAPNPEGKTVSLKESLGKVTIVDFWASWCKPCRAENPAVVALYKEFHDKGLNIIGVSLDNDAKAWKEAIAKDGLTWTQVAHLNPQGDPIVKQYNINEIPATFLLDANGKIVAKDLRGAELKAKIASLLGV